MVHDGQQWSIMSWWLQTRSIIGDSTISAWPTTYWLVVVFPDRGDCLELIGFRNSHKAPCFQPTDTRNVAITGHSKVTALVDQPSAKREPIGFTNRIYQGTNDSWNLTEPVVQTFRGGISVVNGASRRSVCPSGGWVPWGMGAFPNEQADSRGSFKGSPLTQRVAMSHLWL